MKRIILCLLLLAFMFSGCNMKGNFIFTEDEESEVLTRTDEDPEQVHKCVAIENPGKCSVCGADMPTDTDPPAVPSVPEWYLDFPPYTNEKIVTISFGADGGVSVLELHSNTSWIMRQDPNSSAIPGNEIRIAHNTAPDSNL